MLLGVQWPAPERASTLLPPACHSTSSSVPHESCLETNQLLQHDVRKVEKAKWKSGRWNNMLEWMQWHLETLSYWGARRRVAQCNHSVHLATWCTAFVFENGVRTAVGKKLRRRMSFCGSQCDSCWAAVDICALLSYLHYPPGAWVGALADVVCGLGTKAAQFQQTPSDLPKTGYVLCITLLPSRSRSQDLHSAASALNSLQITDSG